MTVMSNNHYGYLKYILLALAIGFLILTPRPAERKKPSSTPGDTKWFQSTVVEESRPVLVKFGAEWCGPCRSMDSTIASIEPALKEKVKIVRVDVDENPDLASQYGVHAIPHSFLFSQGKVLDQRKGSMDADSLLDWVDSVASQPIEKRAER
jgi:thioredoxin